MFFLRRTKRFAQRGQGILTHSYVKVQHLRTVSKCSQHQFMDFFVRMSFVSIMSMLIASSFATSSLPLLPGLEPLCFTPPDIHPVRTVIDTCEILLKNFVESQKPHGGILRWTSNASETGDNVIHLPKIEYRINQNQTKACLFEVLDTARVGDSFPATTVQKLGTVILDECFSNNKCGLVALPPHYTTSLSVCGSYHRPNRTEFTGPSYAWEPAVRTERK